MSEILTAEQVAELFANQMNTQCRVYFEVVGQSHEALRDLYDALLQGATAQRVATLMDEADRARVEIERLKEDNWRLEKERKIAQVLRNDTWVELAALRARIAELEKERDALWQFYLKARDHRDQLIGQNDAAIAERDGLRRAIEAFSKAYSDWPSAPDERHQRPTLYAAMDALRALAAVPAPVAQQGKSHAHQWFKNGDYREDSMFGISCPVWACGSCKITCSATDKPSENL